MRQACVTLRLLDIRVLYVEVIQPLVPLLWFGPFQVPFAGLLNIFYSRHEKILQLSYDSA